SASLLVYHFCIFFKHAVISHTGRFLQHVDSCRIVPVFLAAASHLMLSNAVQCEIHCSSKGIEGFGMKLIHVFGNVIQGDAAYTADCACKIFIDDFLGNTDSLKDLCAL